jgi:hypothetical protein
MDSLHQSFFTLDVDARVRLSPNDLEVCAGQIKLKHVEVQRPNFECSNMG